MNALYIFLSLAASALGASNVIDLDATTFGSHIGANPLVLAEFFAPWCGHCKNLAPEYEKAADALSTNENISLVKVDCQENQALCNEYGIKGFPTLYVFEDGEQTAQYGGARKAEDIESYLLKRAEPAVAVVEASGFEKWLAAHKTGSPVIFAYFGPEEHVEVFSKLANANRDQLAFVSAVDSADLAKKYGGNLVVFKDNLATEAKPFDGETLDKETIKEFIEANAFPVFGELDGHNYMNYIESKIPMLYAFVTEDAHRELVKEALKPHIETLGGKANIVFLDATRYGRQAQALSMREEFPAIAVHELVNNKKFIHDQSVALSTESISEFIKNYLAGKIEPYVRSEPIPESQDEAVYTLVGSEFEAVVLDDEKDVLVEYYAPWCGHCKNLAPIYLELAELYSDNDNVVIAKVDHTANDVPAAISGYPTLIFYPAGQKDMPIEFDGKRTLEGLSEFIAEHGKATPKKAAPKAPKVPKVPTDEDEGIEKQEL